MKIVLNTVPIRPTPTDYPPFGSLALIQSLRGAGYDPYFYDIDGLRPSMDEVLAFYKREKPDLIAVSAVVSTAYGYVKNLCLALKRELPGTPIVLGGNLAASAELLLRRCGVDICVAGEGERVIVELANHFREHPGLPVDKEALGRIRSISFLDGAGNMAFTNYDLPIHVDDFLDPDYSILERFSRIENYVRPDPFSRTDFAQDPRSREPHRKGQAMATVVSAKGCVARCTFCHRWDKGYRHLDPPSIIRRMQYLRDRYNVGFFQFGDENFGSDREKLEEFLRLVKPMDVLYQVAGVRCRSVDPALLTRLRESGCVALYYGMETGSPRILKVMEKNASLEHNLQAALWTHEAGLYTIYQLVLAMPGETSETIGETLDFVKKVTEKLPDPPHKRLSINYIQALPGTATYEYAREKGLIAKTMDDEDRYLTRISDIDASDDSKFLNFTEEDTFTVQSWRFKLLFEAEAHYYRSRGWKTARAASTGLDTEEADYYVKGGYFNIKKMVHSPFFYRRFYFLRYAYYAAHVLAKNLLRTPFRQFLANAWDFAKTRFRKHPALAEGRSLRRIVTEIAPPAASPSEAAMLPLRQGR